MNKIGRSTKSGENTDGWASAWGKRAFGSQYIVCATALIFAVALSTILFGCSDSPLFVFPDPAVRIIAFGDSTTAGPSDKQYTEFLQENPAFDPAAIVNQGMGGETTVDGIERLRGIFNAGLYPNGEAIVIWEGGNDLIDFIQQRDPFLAIPPGTALYLFEAELNALLADIRTNLTQMVQLSKDQGLSPIIVTYFFIPETPIECGATFLEIILPNQAFVTNEYTRRLNDVIREIATNESTTLVDVAAIDAELRGDVANYENCNHLSEMGNGRAAGLIATALADVLNN